MLYYRNILHKDTSDVFGQYYFNKDHKRHNVFNEITFHYYTTFREVKNFFRYQVLFILPKLSVVSDTDVRKVR